MKLYEFFGSISHDVNGENKKSSEELSKEKENQLADDVFWFIIDNDDLHKKYFMPAAREIKKTSDDAESMHDWKVWKPMVNAGCLEYFHENDVPGDPKVTFNKKFRADLCKRMCEHFHKDIIKGEYNLGH